ncbi:hypothetical protein [Amycolatopsis sp. WGS_07]|uniref:hypothetical protein n=1 Tax=Amycolatopsis sp. WGS_07 TaxID=3076764 RepID=UPI003872A7A2
MTAVLAAVLGATLGAIGALVVSRANSRRSERVTMTSALIAEYFSTEFLHHRISIGNTSEKVRNGELSFEEIATGYWYPGAHDTFTGDDFNGLNEHQHIEAYIGFIVRIDYLLDAGRVYATELRGALGMKLMWEDFLLTGLASACLEQTRRANVQPPDWTRSISRVHDEITIAPRAL